MPAARPNKIVTVVRAIVRLGLFVGLLFGTAGRLDWWQGWGFIIFFVTAAGLLHLVMRRHDPELIERRRSLGKGTKSWDKVLLVPVVSASLFVALVAGLGVRFDWASFDGWTFWPGVILSGLGFFIVARAMMENTHFEGSVRIQTDRGHRVIDSGPYALVRHPGYVGALVSWLGMPLMLCSPWAFVPVAVGSATLVLRTALEDRTLRRELSGYARYARRVRHRLLPGVW